MFSYLAFGVQIQSEFEIPGLSQFSNDNIENDSVQISLGKVPESLMNDPLEIKPFSIYNENEFIFNIPFVAKYYTRDGKKVTIEPISDNFDEVLFYFYTGVLATILFQRNLVPFHVSGVLLNNDSVLLIAGHQRAGKSTTSIMLQNRGYLPFTDDTAVLKVEEGICYAYSSYPIIRALETTLEKQQVYAENEIGPIIKEGFKYGINFHDKFIQHPLSVSGIVFLSEEGDEVSIKSIKAMEAIKLLKYNIYRKQWIAGMKKEILEFQTISKIAQSSIRFYGVKRPLETDSFEELANSIEVQIINQIGS